MSCVRTTMYLGQDLRGLDLKARRSLCMDLFSQDQDLLTSCVPGALNSQNARGGQSCFGVMMVAYRSGAIAHKDVKMFSNSTRGESESVVPIKSGLNYVLMKVLGDISNQFRMYKRATKTAERVKTLAFCSCQR